MPIGYGLSLLLLIAASAIRGAVIVLTIFFLVPIKNRLARVDPDALLRVG